jgi:uncharacterized protein (DUF4415 family)
MSVATTGKNLKKATEPRTNWKRLRSLTGAQIRASLCKDPEVVPTDPTFWAKAKVMMPRSKKTVTMRLDADLLDWFRSNSGYQTRINAVLRAYMNARLQSVEADPGLQRMMAASLADVEGDRVMSSRQLMRPRTPR